MGAGPTFGALSGAKAEKFNLWVIWSKKKKFKNYDSFQHRYQVTR